MVLLQLICQVAPQNIALDTVKTKSVSLHLLEFEIAINLTCL